LKICWGFQRATEGGRPYKFGVILLMNRSLPPASSLLTPVLACGLAAALLCAPETAAEGVRAGLTLCAATLIPSLFPFLALSGFWVESGLCAATGRVLEGLTRRLFRLPGAAGGVLFMSLVGGFPVGLRMTAALLEQGAVTQKQAARMSLFCVNAGPAFVVGAVGTAMLDSRRAGFLLYGSLCLAALCLGVVSRFFARVPSQFSGRRGCRPLHRDTEKSTTAGGAPPGNIPVPHRKGVGTAIRATGTPYSAAMVTAVADATGAMISVCAWILLFSCGIALLALLPLPAALLTALRALLEVSGGCAALSPGGSLPVFAALLGWCGLCVQCQLFPFVRRCGQKLSVFVLFRLAAAGLSALLCRVLLWCFPLETPVFSNGVGISPVPYALSAPAAAALLVLGGLLILDVEYAKVNFRN